MKENNSSENIDNLRVRPDLHDADMYEGPFKVAVGFGLRAPEPVTSRVATPEPTEVVITGGPDAIDSVLIARRDVPASVVDTIPPPAAPVLTMAPGPKRPWDGPYDVPAFGYAIGGAGNVAVAKDLLNGFETMTPKQREAVLAKVVTLSPYWPNLCNSLKSVIGIPGPVIVAWAMLRNRWSIETGRTFSNRLISATGAMGVGQVLRSTSRALRKTYPGLGTLPTPMAPLMRKSGNSDPNLILAAIGESICAYLDVIRAVSKLGIPPIVMEEGRGLPTHLLRLMAMTFYYHNGWSKAPRKISTATLKYDLGSALRSQARREAQAYRGIIKGKSPLMS